MLYKKFKVVANDYINAGKASSQIKKSLKEIGIDSKVLRKIAVSCYEAEINMIIHAYGGEITLNIFDDRINLLFEDLGPGIEDIDQAMVQGYSTANEKAREMGFGAGMGLYNISRLSDSMKIESSSNATVIELDFTL